MGFGALVVVIGACLGFLIQDFWFIGPHPWAGAGVRALHYWADLRFCVENGAFRAEEYWRKVL